MTAAGTRARLAVAVPQEAPVNPHTLISALLTLGRQVLEEYRLTGQQLPEVEVTAVERAETVPATAATTGFTVGVTNDLEAKRSTLLLAGLSTCSTPNRLITPATPGASTNPPPKATAQATGAAAATEPTPDSSPCPKREPLPQRPRYGQHPVRTGDPVVPGSAVPAAGA
jgi:hypothetical protein